MRQAMGYAELKHHSRQDCPDQLRDAYVPPPYDRTPCFLNEKTCHNHYESTGMGSNISITYDWKHFIYEDYDRWLYNRRVRCSLLRPSVLAVDGADDCQLSIGGPNCPNAFEDEPLVYQSTPRLDLETEQVYCMHPGGHPIRTGRTCCLSAPACMTATTSLKLSSTMPGSCDGWPTT